MKKEVKHHNSKHWQIFCPKCDAWHYVHVRVLVQLYIKPGIQVHHKWLSEPAIICAECKEDVEFLLNPNEKQTIIDLAYSTKV